MNTPAPLNSARLDQLVVEAEAIFHRLVLIARNAHAALDRGDTEAVLEALIQRECLLGQIEPSLRDLMDARERLAGGSNSPELAARVRSVAATVGRIARHTRAADTLLMDRLDAACARLAHDFAPGEPRRPLAPVQQPGRMPRRAQES